MCLATLLEASSEKCTKSKDTSAEWHSRNGPPKGALGGPISGMPLRTGIPRFRDFFVGASDVVAKQVRKAKWKGCLSVYADFLDLKERLPGRPQGLFEGMSREIRLYPRTPTEPKNGKIVIWSQQCSTFSQK